MWVVVVEFLNFNSFFTAIVKIQFLDSPFLVLASLLALGVLRVFALFYE